MAKEINYNPYLIKKIQPVGGIKFEDRQIVKGDGFEACIQIYDLPTYVDNFWLESILSYEDVVATVDIATEDRKVSLDKLNKSIREQADRYYHINDNVDKINAAAESRNLTDLVEEITQSDEIIKLVTIRLYVSAKTSKELEDRVKHIVENLTNEGFRGSVFLNEQEYEWKALFKGATEQSKELPGREGKQIPSFALGGGYPFHYSELTDPTGIYIGTTRTGGNVLFDLFTRNEIRKSYNALVVGMMGSGKSTFLKKLLVNNAIVNNTIRVLDIAGEFKTLVTTLGGKVIALDGSDGIINPLQIFATVIDETNNKVNEENSFMLHLSKVSMIYQFISPNSEQAEIREFEKILSDFYTDYGIERSKATTYNTLQYPIMEELVEYAKKQLYSDDEFTIVRENLTQSRQERLEHIILNLEGIVRDYGALFNGHSSIENIDKEQIVSFEVKNLTQFDKRIFEAQTFNILTMLWNNALQQGIREKKMFESGIKTFDEAKKYLLILDEAHKFVNTDNMIAVDYLIRYEREARKYFSGLILATQSIRDVVPESCSTEELSKLKTLFELSQYKFILQQDNNAKKAIAEIFSNQITTSEIELIPFLRKGECIMAINGDRNLTFKIDATNEELKLFEGGA